MDSEFDAEEITALALRRNLGDMIDRVTYGGERLLITSHGRPRFALVTVDDLIRLEKLDRKKRNSQSG